MDPETLKAESEIRKDYRTGRLSIIVPGRDVRPKEILEEDAALKDLSVCPFEPENIHVVNIEIARSEDPWSVLVIQNKFPELSGTTPLFTDSDDKGLFTKMGGYGYNEVVIESPKHTDLLEKFGDEKLMTWLGVLIDREEALYARRYIKYVQVFKNYGVSGGASIGHPHTQIMAWPGIFGTVKKELKRVRRYGKAYGACLYEDALKTERGRLLWEGQRMIAIAPFASRFGGESMLLPKRHVNYVGELSMDEKREFVHAIKIVLLTNKKLFGAQDYNLVFHELKTEDAFHMHAEIYPRMTTLAGVELGEGIFVNTVVPEVYADHFRDAVKDLD